ncbi:MAG TPA: asparagine--tRNA ligase [Ignavibacteria bacterium]|jgi:asparaginyl-tRNA synthetase
MQKRYYIDKIADFVGQEVTIKGWLYNIRTSGKLMFPQLRDGTGIIQGVVSQKDVSPAVWEGFKSLTQESSLIVKGIVSKHPKKDEYELQVSDLEIVQIAEPYPITPKDHGVEFLADHRHLWVRSPKQIAILRVREEIIKACRDYMYDNGFVLFDSPIFTPNAAEGTTTLFSSDYFDLGKVYLAQTGQLYAEAGAMAFGKVYDFGPTFRAEKSKTRRHLTEFWMIEPEMAYYDLYDDMDLIEDFIEYIVQRVLKNRSQELASLERDISKLELIKKPFPRITYDEAIDIINKKNVPLIRKKEDGTEEHIRPFPWGEDFGAPHEEAVVEDFDKPVMVYNWPSEAKAFYMKRDPANPKIVRGVDVLAPEGYGEIVGGSEREDNLELLVQRIKEHNLPMEAFQWYIDLRRYGSVPHSGFGMGVERVVSWICKLDHLREAIPFPRMMYRNKP